MDRKAISGTGEAISEKVRKLDSIGSNRHFPWRGIIDFGNDEFYGFAAILGRKG